MKWLGLFVVELNVCIEIWLVFSVDVAHEIELSGWFVVGSMGEM